MSTIDDLKDAIKQTNVVLDPTNSVTPDNEYILLNQACIMHALVDLLECLKGKPEPPPGGLSENPTFKQCLDASFPPPQKQPQEPAAQPTLSDVSNTPPQE